MTLDQFNTLNKEEATEALTKCCGAANWVSQMETSRPFKNIEQLIEAAQSVWDSCSDDDGLEAFTHHPKIGNLKNLEEKYALTKDWAGHEQAGVKSADHKVLQELAKGNRAYEMKFGYIFIVFATGKSAKEMLDLLKERLHSLPADELKTAMSEQYKITKLRINKLLA